MDKLFEIKSWAQFIFFQKFSLYLDDISAWRNSLRNDFEAAAVIDTYTLILRNDLLFTLNHAFKENDLILIILLIIMWHWNVRSPFSILMCSRLSGKQSAPDS